MKGSLSLFGEALERKLDLRVTLNPPVIVNGPACLVSKRKEKMAESEGLSTTDWINRYQFVSFFTTSFKRGLVGSATLGFRGTNMGMQRTVGCLESKLDFRLILNSS